MRSDPVAPIAIDVANAIDAGGWGRYQRRLVALTATAVVFDGFDNQLLGLALPAIMSDWGHTRSAFAPIVSLGFLGMMIGGATGGSAGDHLGRRAALVMSVVTFAVATSAIALVGGVGALAACRFIAGLGLGAALPNATALAAEYVPARQRSMAVTITIVCVPLGGTLAGLFAVPLLTTVGWRGLFLIGGLIPLAFAAGAAFMLAESPRYLARHPPRWPELARLLRRMGHDVALDSAFQEPHSDATARAPFRALLDPHYRRDTLALWGAFLSCLLAVYLGFSWLPSMLTTAGLGATVASTGLTVFNLGGVFGALLGGWLIGRVGSRPTMLTMTAAAMTGAITLAAMDLTSQASVGTLIVMLAITGGLINAVQTTMYALAANIYPTHFRATGVGTASSVGRSGAILSGYLGPWALQWRGSESFFGVMAAALFVAFVSLAVIRRHVPAR
jgi:AAHS family 4-hydroxybenzoate transporter-like MFS transporter